jgi:hypothetical protein
MAATSVVFDQLRPARIGNTVFGTLSGTFVDAAVGDALYADSLAAVAGRFLPSPPPRIVQVTSVSGTNTHAFIAVGRAV